LAAVIKFYKKVIATQEKKTDESLAEEVKMPEIPSEHDSASRKGKEKKRHYFDDLMDGNVDFEG